MNIRETRDCTELSLIPLPRGTTPVAAETFFEFHPTMYLFMSSCSSVSVLILDALDVFIVWDHI